MDLFAELLSRNIEKIYPSKKSLCDRLNGNKTLKIYLGIDPSSTSIHLGNAIALRKLREFQNFGHKVILVIGDFTGMIGDPTDKSSTRKPLTHKQVLENSSNYKSQAAKILNFSGKNPAELVYNSHWLSNLSFQSIIKLAGHFSVQQMLERDMFQERLKSKKSIGLHEFLYPLSQGYDSVALDVDIEIGGSDQTFNMLVGRHLVKELSQKEKFVITLPLLEGTDGRKMSKSFGNSIDLTDPPETMYGKIMSLKDSLIYKYFKLCTNLSISEIKKIKQNLISKNPIILKKKLAYNIVSQYYSEKEAVAAQNEFVRVVQKRKIPSLVEEHSFSRSILPKPFHYFLTETEMVESISHANRLAKQGAIIFDGVKVEKIRDLFDTNKNSILVKAGKRNYKKIIFT